MLYALLCVGDDRVDVSFQKFASKRAAIEDWEQACWQTFETGRSDHPVLRAFRPRFVSPDVYPLTAPAASPVTMSRWTKIVSSSVGNVTISAAAASGPHDNCS